MIKSYPHHTTCAVLAMRFERTQVNALFLLEFDELANRTPVIRNLRLSLNKNL